MKISISAAAPKRDPKKYKWYIYKGRTASFEVDSDYDFSLSKDEKFGVKKIRDIYYLVDASNLEVQFKLKVQDSARILKNSRGYTGKVGRVKVEAGTEGGLDKAREVKGDLNEVRVDSSMLSNVWYNKKTKKLYVTFPNGAEWRYSPVELKEVAALERAKSQGRWFNINIKNVKEAVRVESKTTR